MSEDSRAFVVGILLKGGLGKRSTPSPGRASTEGPASGLGVLGLRLRFIGSTQQVGLEVAGCSDIFTIYKLKESQREKGQLAPGIPRKRERERDRERTVEKERESQRERTDVEQVFTGNHSDNQGITHDRRCMWGSK